MNGTLFVIVIGILLSMPLRTRLPVQLSPIARTMSNAPASASASPFAPKAGAKLTLASTVALQDGTQQPRFGIGAWAMRGEECYTALKHALDVVGYRHIDTARYYRNEKEVGRAIRESNVPRDQIYATTKLFTNDMVRTFLPC